MKSLNYLFVLFLFASTILLSQPQWELKGLAGTYIRHLAGDDNGNIYAASLSDSISYSSDFGNTWVPKGKIISQPGWISLRSITLDSDNELLAAVEKSNNLFKSIDKGETWFPFGSGLESNIGSSFFVIWKLIRYDDGRYYAATTEGVYLSTDEGGNWNKLNIDPSDRNAEDVAADTNGRMIISGLGEIFTSTDYGATWIKNNTLNNFTQPYLVHSGNGNVFMATDGGGVFFTSDMGVSWKRIDYGKVGPANCVRLDRNGTLFVGTELTGAMYTTDLGETWNSLSNGLAAPDVDDFYFDKDNYAICSVNEKGVYKTVSPVTSVSDEDKSNPVSFILEQNYPNPFNPSTVITYSLAEGGLTSLKVFDVLGNEITALVNEFKTAGSHTVNFDGNGLTSGVYFYTLISGGVTASKKMILAR